MLLYFFWRRMNGPLVTPCFQNASSLAIEQGKLIDSMSAMAFISIHHYPLELASHPDVLEVTVVARTHDKWGERPMAFVVLHPQLVSSWKGRHNDFGKELKAHAKERLPGFACPEWVEIVQELPVSFVFNCNEYICFN